MRIPNLDCPNCQEGMVFENKGRLFCEDCHTAFQVLPINNSKPPESEPLLTKRESALITMACVMKIRHFQEPPQILVFGAKCHEVIDEYQAIIAKVTPKGVTNTETSS